MTHAPLPRCEWATKDPLYIDYHDREWGTPIHDDRTLFEFLTLESAQAGLSWLTVLRKREAYRAAFAGFDVEKVARFTPKRIETLMNNPGIIRNRRKIEAAIRNARCFQEIQAEFGSFDTYSWRFVEGAPIVNAWKRLDELPTTSAESEAFSRDLKSRGFKFLGPTIMYAHMQACGLINDHLVTCFRYRELRDAHR